MKKDKNMNFLLKEFYTSIDYTYNKKEKKISDVLIKNINLWHNM